MLRRRQLMVAQMCWGQARGMIGYLADKRSGTLGEQDRGRSVPSFWHPVEPAPRHGQKAIAR